MVFAVNCYLSETLVNYNAPHARLTNLENNNQARRERDPRDNPILPAWGFSICNHGTRKKKTYPHEDLPWGTVSAEVLQPAKKVFWYCYGWPCGGKPEYGDQIHQEGPLTTPHGELTPLGNAFDLNRV